MDDSVPDGRRRRGLATRARIAEAAWPLFAQTGFDGTTVAAIARAAGVSEPSVYYAYGSKEAILAAAIDVAVAGDQAPTPTLDRPWAQAALDDPDPRGQLRRQVDGAGVILRRAGPLLEVLRSGASSNETLAQTWTENVRRRRTVQAAFIDSLATKTDLAPGLTKRRAADICTLLLGPESYGFLTGPMGWSHRAWLLWTPKALAAQLLPPS